MSEPHERLVSGVDFVALLEREMRAYEERIVQQINESMIWLPPTPALSTFERLRNRGHNAVYDARMKLASAIAGFDVEDRW